MRAQCSRAGRTKLVPAVRSTAMPVRRPACPVHPSLGHCAEEPPFLRATGRQLPRQQPPTSTTTSTRHQSHPSLRRSARRTLLLHCGPSQLPSNQPLCLPRWPSMSGVGWGRAGTVTVTTPPPPTSPPPQMPPPPPSLLLPPPQRSPPPLATQPSFAQRWKQPPPSPLP